MLAMFVVLGALPLVIAAVHLDGFHLVKILRWPMLFAIIVVTLAMLFRVAPSPRIFDSEERGRRRIWPGAGVATLLLVLVSPPGSSTSYPTTRCTERSGAWWS